MIVSCPRCYFFNLSASSYILLTAYTLACQLIKKYKYKIYFIKIKLDASVFFRRMQIPTREVEIEAGYIFSADMDVLTGKNL
jgi:hypothetical protein